MPPARRTPTAPTLTVRDETLRVGDGDAENAQQSTPAPIDPAPGSASTTTGTSAATSENTGPKAEAEAERINITKTLRFYDDTERRMQFVVNMGRMTEGMPTTITEFVNDAFDAHLKRLAEQFNGGEPFPMAPRGTRGVTGPRPR